MKKLFVMALALVALAGCKSKSSEPQEVAVSFNVSNLQVTTAAMGPHRASIKDAAITDLWVMVNGVEKKHQSSTDKDFGQFTLSLKYGKQTIDFIGGTREGQSMTDGVWSCDKVDGTYAESLELDVTPTTAAQTVELRHIDYIVDWHSTDKMPDDIATVVISIKDWHGSLGKGLVPATTADKEIELNVTSKRGYLLEVFMGGFCSVPFGEEYEDVTATFKALDDDGVVQFEFEKVVPVKSNSKTIISGRMFGYNEQPTLSVNTNYAEEKQIPL